MLIPTVEGVVNVLEFKVLLPVKVVPDGQETAMPDVLELAFCDIVRHGVGLQPELTPVMVVFAGIFVPITGKPTARPVLLVKELIVLPLVFPVPAP